MGFKKAVRRATPRQIEYLVENLGWLPVGRQMAADKREPTVWARGLTFKQASNLISGIVDDKIRQQSEEEVWWECLD